MTEQTKVWVVTDFDYDSATMHAAFERKEDAEAWAKATSLTAEAVPFYVAGTAPLVRTVWDAQAEVFLYGGRQYPRKPPEVSSRSFSEFEYSDNDERLKPAVARAYQVHDSSGGTVLFIRATGADREACLTSVSDRYEKALKGWRPDGSEKGAGDGC